MMTASVCPSGEELRALALGQLPDEQSDVLFEHVRACDQCQSELETAEESHDSLIASLRSPGDFFDVFEREPDCQLAIAKAMGALAGVKQFQTATDLGHLPQQIGEYELVRPLGHGGMGSVFLARHSKLGREVALKVLAGHRLADARMRERFAAEMRAVGRLSHPNIVTAHDAREVEGTAVLVTEFIDGLDLSQLVQRTGPLAMADACEIVRQIAIALEYTSQQGFVHRDVKPSNIMLSYRGEVKLLDLGLARLQLGAGEQADITGTGQAMGTADYIAPEQVTDSRSVDVRADLYALGCTLFKLLTGEAPFADAEHVTTFAKMTAHVSTQPPSLSDRMLDAPRTLVQLVDSLLAKAPDDRPQRPQAVADRLMDFNAGCDLEQLAQRAADLQPRLKTDRSALVTETQSTERSQPARGRQVPLAFAVAAGFFGLAVGLCLGIIITITNPDGTKSILQLAPGSKVEVSEGTPPTDASEKEAPEQSTFPITNNPVHAEKTLLHEGQPAPLCFGILVNRTSSKRQPSATDAEIMQATTVLQLSPNSGGYVSTPIGLWLPLAEDLPTPIKAYNGGTAYTLIDLDPKNVVGWNDIHNHVLSMMVSTQVDLEFDQPLAEKMSKLTRENIRSQMAIIVNGRIRSAPYINSEVGAKVAITGKFDRGEALQLSQWLHGGLVDPLPKRNAAEPRSKTANEAFNDWWGNLGNSFFQPQPVPAAQTSKNNLKKIGLAFHNFHDAYRRFPASSNTLEGSIGVPQGKKIYPFSWRVAILPFVEQNELFEQYRFDEPWDSGHNATLVDKMPDVFRSPYAPDSQAVGETNYLGIVGDPTALGAEKGVMMRDMLDGTSNTLLLVETKMTVPWTKPADIAFDDLGNVKQAIPFDEPPLNYLTADGAVHSMQPIDWELLSKLITRDGGEVIPR